MLGKKTILVLSCEEIRTNIDVGVQGGLFARLGHVMGWRFLLNKRCPPRCEGLLTLYFHSSAPTHRLEVVSDLQERPTCLKNRKQALEVNQVTTWEAIN